MRTSGGSGNERWIIAIPILGLIIASTMSAGGVDGMLFALEGVVRTAISSVLDFARALSQDVLVAPDRHMTTVGQLPRGSNRAAARFQ